MKIFTYYENIDFANQDQLITLWANSWRTHGFHPVVLTNKEAQKSNFYEEFTSKLKVLHQEIAGKPLNRYGLSCWIRWLAYSTQEESGFYVSDYDVINHNFNLKNIESTLHLMNENCPCFASGSPSQFLQLCQKFINVTEQNKEEYKELFKKFQFRHFHDQEFFWVYHYGRRTDENIKVTKGNIIVSDLHSDTEFFNKPLVHYSHYGCRNFLNTRDIPFGEIEIERCNLIKKYALNK
jgi:hypothetical protein